MVAAVKSGKDAFNPFVAGAFLLQLDLGKQQPELRLSLVELGHRRLELETQLGQLIQQLEEPILKT